MTNSAIPGANRFLTGRRCGSLLRFQRRRRPVDSRLTVGNQATNVGTHQHIESTAARRDKKFSAGCCPLCLLPPVWNSGGGLLALLKEGEQFGIDLVLQR